MKRGGRPSDPSGSGTSIGATAVRRPPGGGRVFRDRESGGGAMEEAHQADQQEQEQEQQEQQEQANQPDQKEGTAVGPGQDVPEGGGRAEYRIGIEGNAAGPVVAGNHNVVVDAQHGSTVTLLMERERPRPVRRSGVELLPRRQREPVGREAEITALTAAVQAGGRCSCGGRPGSAPARC